MCQMIQDVKEILNITFYILQDLNSSPLVLWDSFLWKDNSQMENYWESHSYTSQEALVDHAHPLFQPCIVLNMSREENNIISKTFSAKLLKSRVVESTASGWYEYHMLWNVVSFINLPRSKNNQPNSLRNFIKRANVPLLIWWHIVCDTARRLAICESSLALWCHEDSILIYFRSYSFSAAQSDYRRASFCC